MAALITDNDLQEYGITIADTERPVVNRLIRSASAAVIEAAGSPILAQTTTVNLPVIQQGNLLELPGLPIASVESVFIGDTEVTDFLTLPNGIYRAQDWRYLGPAIATITYKHGLLAVPDDLVELLVLMVNAGLQEFRETGAAGFILNNGKVQSTKIDDYSRTESTSADASELVSPMTLPPRTRAALARRFGSGGPVVTNGL